jgi:acyl carrier protein
MRTIDDFVHLLHEELGMPVTVEDTRLGLDHLPDWDSLHMLSLLTVLERRTGRSISLPDALQATSLAEIFDLSVER